MSAAAEPLAAPNGIAAVDSAGDIVDNGALSSAPDSPAVPSPVSPYDASPTVKIDTDYLHRDNESDSRHEPLDLNISQLDKTDDASTRPQLGTPADPGNGHVVLFLFSLPLAHRSVCLLFVPFPVLFCRFNTNSTTKRDPAPSTRPASGGRADG